MAHENVPSSKRKDVSRETDKDADTTRNEAEEREVSEDIQETSESTHPTSNDVGKQTRTQADLGYDVTKEGVPPDDVAMVTPQHPDDPSAHEESEYNT